ncbi:hypothetical protein ACFVH6_36815 [Spirillospora sp. NPDC127200]
MAERLQPGLRDRHVSMVAIGGVSGAGLFVGSGAGIWRIIVFRPGPGAVVVTPLPWDSADVGRGPYAAVPEEAGTPGAGPRAFARTTTRAGRRCGGRRRWRPQDVRSATEGSTSVAGAATIGRRAARVRRATLDA